jgi:hypothetical protein
MHYIFKKKKHTGWAWWLMVVNLAAWEAEIRRITVQGQPSQQKELGMMVYVCYPSLRGKHK